MTLPCSSPNLYKKIKARQARDNKSRAAHAFFFPFLSCLVTVGLARLCWSLPAHTCPGAPPCLGLILVSTPHHPSFGCPLAARPVALVAGTVRGVCDDPFPLSLCHFSPCLTLLFSPLQIHKTRHGLPPPQVEPAPTGEQHAIPFSPPPSPHEKPLEERRTAGSRTVVSMAIAASIPGITPFPSRHSARRN
jgi:hypothetical protein